MIKDSCHPELAVWTDFLDRGLTFLGCLLRYASSKELSGIIDLVRTAHNACMTRCLTCLGIRPDHKAANRPVPLAMTTRAVLTARRWHACKALCKQGTAHAVCTSSSAASCFTQHADFGVLSLHYARPQESV